MNCTINSCFATTKMPKYTIKINLTRNIYTFFARLKDLIGKKSIDYFIFL